MATLIGAGIDHRRIRCGNAFHRHLIANWRGDRAAGGSLLGFHQANHFPKLRRAADGGRFSLLSGILGPYVAVGGHRGYHARLKRYLVQV